VGSLANMAPTVPAPPVSLSKIGRAAHDVGLAGLLGGNLFGRLALHPSVTEISDPAERGKIVNAAWRRYGAVNSLSLAAVTAGWLGARLRESANRNLSDEERRLAYAKDAPSTPRSHKRTSAGHPRDASSPAGAGADAACLS
jgi:hypothetical protein